MDFNNQLNSQFDPQFVELFSKNIEPINKQFNILKYLINLYPPVYIKKSNKNFNISCELELFLSNIYKMIAFLIHCYKNQEFYYKNQEYNLNLAIQQLNIEIDKRNQSIGFLEKQIDKKR